MSRWLFFLSAVFVSIPSACSATLVFDHIGQPGDTSGPSGFSVGSTNLEQAFEFSYGTTATRFTLDEDYRGERLGAVVWGNTSSDVPFTPAQWQQINFLVEVWDINPGLAPDPRRGNYFASDPVSTGLGDNIQRTILSGGDFTTPWSSVDQGNLPTYKIELDISDIVFEGGQEYWLAVRSLIPFEALGRMGVVTRNSPGQNVPESEADIWASNVVGTVEFPPFSGNIEDRWVSIGRFQLDKWAYSLTVSPIPEPNSIAMMLVASLFICQGLGVRQLRISLTDNKIRSQVLSNERC